MEGLCNVYNDKGMNDMIYTAVLERWDVQRDNACYKQVFGVKKNVGLPPHLELLAVIIRKSGYDNMPKRCNHIQKIWATQFHSGMDTQTHCALIFPSLNPPHLKLYQSIWLVMHVILPSHIVFLHSRHKHNSECSDMHTGTVFSQGRREIIWVQTVLVAGDNRYLYVRYHCVLSFPMRNTASN